MLPEERRLLLSIARCDLLSACLDRRVPAPPCTEIIHYQQDGGAPLPYPRRQVPEPWTGHLAEARLLFLASNPSISWEEKYPLGSDSDELILDFFYSRFDDRRPNPWVRNGNKFLQTDGTYSHGARFWSSVKRRAEEAYGREVRPGVDYALSEVVHCKSTEEIGVLEAADQCSRRYLRSLLGLSGARVVIVLGTTAAEVLHRRIALRQYRPEWPAAWVDDRRPDRLFLFQPHPNARKVRQLAQTLPPDLLSFLRVMLNR